MTLRKTVGGLLVATPIIALFIYEVIHTGVWPALGTFALVLGIILITALGFHLLEG